MYFVNMTGMGANGRVELNRGRATAIPLVVDDVGGTVKGSFVLQNGKVMLGEGKNIFGSGLEGGDELYLPQFNKNSKLTYTDIKDTEENPIIVVLCSQIGLYKGVSANIKFLYLGKEGILAALISGACEFDGVPLQRCNTTDLDNRSVVRVLKGEDMCRLFTFTDSETGYNYLWDVVAQVNLLEKEDKKGNSSFSCSYIKDGEFWLSEEGLKNAKVRKEEEEAKKKAQEEARKAKLEEEARLAEQKRAERKAKEEEELKRKAEERALAKQLKPKKDEKVVSVGANSFLAAVAQLAQN